MKTALLVLVLGVSPPQSGGSVELVARHAQGDLVEEKESFWSAASGAARDSESNQPSFAWSTAHARAARGDGSVCARESTLLDEVLAVQDGVRVKVRRTFVANASTLVDPDAADATPRRTRALFEGQTVVLVADGNDTRIVGEIDGEEQLAASELSLSTRWEQVLPPAPVALGDTWSLPEASARRLLEELAPSKATAWCKLVRLEAGACGTVACLQLELHATASPGFGLTAEIESSGAVLWDLAAGHLVELRLSGEIQTTDAEGGEQTRTFGITHETRKLE